jgi:hypothetical protein
MSDPHLNDEEIDVVLALNGITRLNETPATEASSDPLRPSYQRLPDYVREMLEKPLRNIRATHPEAVTMLRQRLSILENARQFGSSVKLESRIARTRALLGHALALAAAKTSEEKIGACLVRDDAEASHVVIQCSFDLTTEMVKSIRSAGFVASGRTVKRPRKFVDGENVALDAARDLAQRLNSGL